MERGPSYEDLSGIVIFSLQQTLIGRLTGALDERWVHGTTYLKKVGDILCRNLAVISL